MNLKKLRFNFTDCDDLADGEKKRIKKAIRGVVSDLLAKHEEHGFDCPNCPYDLYGDEIHRPTLGCSRHYLGGYVFSSEVSDNGNEYVFAMDAAEDNVSEIVCGRPWHGKMLWLRKSVDIKRKDSAGKKEETV